MKNIYLLALGALLLISGCSSKPPIKAYSGPILPVSKIAKLVIDYKNVWLESIDGKDWKFSREFHLIPGKHSVIAAARVYMFWSKGHLKAQRPSRIKFIAKAGHTYELSADVTNVDHVSGKQYKAKFHYWITDKETGEVVGGRKPDVQ